MKQEKKIRERVDYTDIRHMVEDIGERWADRYAYSFRVNPRDKEMTRKTYPQLRDDIRALSTAFIDKGYAGKHITIVGKYSYNTVLVYYAAQCTASVLIPLDKEWAVQDLISTAEKAEANVIFCDPDVAEKGQQIADAVGAEALIFTDSGINELVCEGSESFLRDSAPYYNTKIDPDALSLLVFTSGTTGKGKGVMLSQRAIIWDLADVVSYIDFSKRTVGVLPLHHTYGSSVAIYGQNSVGIDVYISSGLRYIVPELKEVKPGHLVLVPLYLETFYRKIQASLKDKGKTKLVHRMIKISNFLRKFGIDLRRKLFAQVRDAFGGELDLAISGGAPINQDIIKFFDGIGITVLNGYGITECAPLISVNHSGRIVPGSVGFPIDGDVIRIDDPNEDGEGEICVKGPNVMLGYFKDEAATADAMTADGYFRTGDYGKLSKEGAIVITGRKKNLIILSNGKNVYPEEIESEFIAVPGVLDVIVYEGQSKRGMEYNAIVAEFFLDKDFVAKENITDEKAYLKPFIDEYNKNAVAYKRIQVVKVRDEEFPKNTLRKIMRFKLDMSID